MKVIKIKHKSRWCLLQSQTVKFLKFWHLSGMTSVIHTLSKYICMYFRSKSVSLQTVIVKAHVNTREKIIGMLYSPIVFYLPIFSYLKFLNIYRSNWLFFAKFLKSLDRLIGMYMSRLYHRTGVVYILKTNYYSRQLFSRFIRDRLVCCN